MILWRKMIVVNYIIQYHLEKAHSFQTKHANIHKHMLCRWECNDLHYISLGYDNLVHISIIISSLVCNSLKTSCTFLCLPWIFHKHENWSERGLNTWETISSFQNSFPNDRYNLSYSSLAPTTQWGFSLTFQLQNVLPNINLIFPHFLRAREKSYYSRFFTDSVPWQNIPDCFVHFFIQISLNFHSYFIIIIITVIINNKSINNNK